MSDNVRPQVVDVIATYPIKRMENATLPFSFSISKRFPRQTKTGLDNSTRSIIGALAWIAGEAYYRLLCLYDGRFAFSEVH